MKKKLLKKTAAVSLALLTAFAFMACSDDPEPKDEVWKPTGDEPDSDLKKLHDMILPAGTGATVPAWTVADDGVKDLPAFVTGFLEKGPAPAELKEGSEGYELYNDKFIKYNGKTNRTPELKAAIRKANDENFFDDKEVKNVLMIFCDGWGESHLQASKKYYGDVIVDELPYHAAVNHNSYPKQDSSDAEFGWTFDEPTRTWSPVGKSKATGLSDTTCTDSTAGGSALNTGYTTYYQGCAVDTHGTEVKSILELAREKGMLVGNVTNDYLTDATPATVGIHSPKRKDSNLINGRMFITSPDWIMGRGGFSGFMGSGDPFGTFAGHEYSASYDGMTKSMLEQWFTANKTKLQAWATAMLKEYDGKTAAANYDFKNWKADRNMQQYSTVKAALEALATDGTIRPYIPLGEDPANHYDYNPDAFNKKTGKYEVAPKIGYKIGYGNKPGYEVAFPNYAEMVASTLYALDKRGKAENRGFFAFIENTSSDGWGHAQRALDVLNETQITDEAIAIAAKYVLENPNTLMIVCADHETGGIKYKSGWETNAAGGNIYSTTSGHSGEPTPFFAFGASANVYFSDIPNFDMSQWTPDEKAAYAMGTIYPAPNTWGENGTGQEAQTTATPAAGPAYPKIIRNRQIGIRLGKALGYTNYGDLNGNGVLDPATEGDSIVDVEGAKIASNKVTLN